MKFQGGNFMIRRISLHGGPGSGKSRTAAAIFSRLLKYNIAHVTEWIKKWAILGIKPQSYDQLLVFANQLSEEDMLLRQAELIVTDSPVMLNLAYSAYYGCEYVTPMIAVAKNYERDFPAINFFIERTVPYETFGRYQNYEEALAFDNHLKSFLSEHLESPCISVKVDEIDTILTKIEESIHVTTP
jgi:hypothetical protein